MGFEVYDRLIHEARKLDAAERCRIAGKMLADTLESAVNILRTESTPLDNVVQLVAAARKIFDMPEETAQTECVECGSWLNPNDDGCRFDDHLCGPCVRKSAKYEKAAERDHP